jgi:phosphoribosylformylglycinamidine (FGAM) synthase-like enzyme
MLVKLLKKLGSELSSHIKATKTQIYDLLNRAHVLGKTKVIFDSSAQGIKAFLSHPLIAGVMGAGAIIEQKLQRNGTLKKLEEVEKTLVWQTQLLENAKSDNIVLANKNNDLRDEIRQTERQAKVSRQGLKQEKTAILQAFQSSYCIWRRSPAQVVCRL